MDGAVLTPLSICAQLKNVASALCSRSHRRNEDMSAAVSGAPRPHTYPRATPTKRPALSRAIEPLLCDQQTSEPYIATCVYTKCNGAVRGAFTREVANAWERQVGKPDQPAPLNRVKSLFYDIQLYPTEVQVFEMLAWATKCARRETFILTFGEACVFAAELRRLSRQVRQTPHKPESPQWSIEKEIRSKDTICRPANGSEASSPTCEVFLGGSCNPTTWRAEIAIPKLKKMGISYFNPQVDDWSTELMEAEFQAKNVARALLFVLDNETRGVAASVEAALLAATPKLLLLVMRSYSRQQTIGSETISDQEYIELSRARATLKEAVERRGLPAFDDISSALDCAGEVLRGRSLTHPRHLLGPTIQRLKRYYDAAGGREARLSRDKALQALQDATRVPRDVAERYLPTNIDAVDFETFCVAVAELAASPGPLQSPRAEGVAARLRRAFRSFCGRFTPTDSQSRNGDDSGTTTERGAESGSPGLRVFNARLRSYGNKLSLYIPKNGGHRSEGESATTDSVLTPGSERRLEGLAGMLAKPKYDVYLGGSFPSNSTRPDEVLRREGFTCIMPRPNDYARMYSAPARRSAPAHPESPRRDKKPRPMSPADADVELRTKPAPSSPTQPDRLSVSDFYKVAENITPQPFKGTYDEDQLLSSSVLVFSISSEAPCFATMVLAAHHIGLQPAKTVLVVQPMDPKNSHPYSEVAVKDYNRGRHYLSDLARRSGVPVFDGVEEALACVIARLRAT